MPPWLSSFGAIELQWVDDRGECQTKMGLEQRNDCGSWDEFSPFEIESVAVYIVPAQFVAFTSQ